MLHTGTEMVLAQGNPGAEIVLAQGEMVPVPNPPNPRPAVPPELADFGNKAVGVLKWAVMICGVIGLLACSMMITIGRRNRNQMAQQGLFDSGFVLIGLALGSMAATLVGLFTI